MATTWNAQFTKENFLHTTDKFTFAQSLSSRWIFNNKDFLATIAVNSKMFKTPQFVTEKPPCPTNISTYKTTTAWQIFSFPKSLILMVVIGEPHPPTPDKCVQQEKEEEPVGECSATFSWEQQGRSKQGRSKLGRSSKVASWYIISCSQWSAPDRVAKLRSYDGSAHHWRKVFSSSQNSSQNGRHPESVIPWL